MKSDCSAPSWLRFFMSAGIQKDSAETYAVTFSKNQIQLDMLPEIKKEYLVDMGITLMGHIIAILRHAKTVHTEEVTKSTLSTSKSGNSLPSKTATSTAKPVSKTTPIIVKDKAQPANSVSKPAAKPAVPVESARTTAPMGPRLPPKLSESSSTVEKRRASPVIDIMVTKVSGPSKPPSSSSKSPESPVKRKLASDESAHADESETKRRIFQRLGQVSNPSSSEPPSNGESVFSRLGQKTSEPPKPTNSVPKVVAIIPQYKATVLSQKVKPLPHRVTVKPIISAPKSVPNMRSVPGVVTRSHTSSAMITDPKQKVMMLNRGTLMKTMRADQDVPSKILSSTTLSAEHTSQTIQNARLSKNNIYSRLGKAAMDQEPKKPAAVPRVKRVSFGTVSEKTIPPVPRATFPIGERATPVGFAPYKKKPIGANGVFSRLGI